MKFSTLKSNLGLFVTILIFVLFAGTPLQTEAAVQVYYSVGQNTSDHKTGSPTMTMTGGSATFSVAQTATNLGVGDKVTYNGASVAYISGKVSNTQWSLITATGTVPVDVTGATVNSITHAFSSLSNAITGASASTHLNNTNLVTSDFVLNIPCYYDTGADTTIVDVTGYTTGANNYIRIYTPYDTSTEVNQSQRHSGKWDDFKYALVPAAFTTNSRAIKITNNYVRVEGLQIKISTNAALSSPTAIQIGVNSLASDVRISSNIVRTGTLAGSPTGISALTYASPSSTSSITVFNNLFYDFALSATAGRAFESSAGTGFTHTALFYNNTFHNIARGFVVNSRDIVTAKNNLFASTTVVANGTFQAGTDYNSAATTSMGYIVSGGGNTHDRLNQTFTFVNAAAGDFHLASNDLGAKDRGITDPGTGLFSGDIDNDARSGTWDIGADEYLADIIPPVISSVSSATGTSTATISWNTNESATSTLQYGLTTGYGSASTSNILSTTPSISLTGLTPATTYQFRIVSADALGNATTTINYTFVTLAIDSTAPVATLISTSTSPVTATIVWGTNESATSSIVYGLTTSYGSSTASSTASTSFSTTLTGLTASTTYHFRIGSADATGNYSTSTDYTFTTQALDTQAPIISMVASTSNSSTTATIVWTTNENADAQVEYGLTSSYTASSSIDSTSTTTHTINLTGLTADTVYHFRVLSRDPSGNLGTSSDYTVLTSAVSTSTYYVDQDNPASNDSNPGTELAPFKTIQRAANIVNPGDVVLIKSAVYQNVLSNCAGAICHLVSVSRSGTSNKHIVFKAYGNGPVILSGFGYEDRDLTGDGKADGPTNPSKREILFNITGNYIDVSDIEVTNSQGLGFVIDGSYNTADNISSYGNWSIGISIGNDNLGLVEGNTVKNSVAHHNRHGNGFAFSRNSGALTDLLKYNTIQDSLSYRNGHEENDSVVMVAAGDTAGGGNSDGFGSSKNCADYPFFNPGAPYANYCPFNRFVGNVAFLNSDDGFDTSFADSLFLDNISFGNGPRGNKGFKMLRNVSRIQFIGNIAYKNNSTGFEARINDQGLGSVFLHNIAVGNGAQGLSASADESGTANDYLIAHNNLALGNEFADLLLSSGCTTCTKNWAEDGQSGDMTGNPLINNATPFQNGSGQIAVTFPSGLTTAQKVAWVKTQFQDAFGLQSGSGAIDAGVPVEYWDPVLQATSTRAVIGAAPDIGKYEFNSGAPDTSAPVITFVASTTSTSTATITWTTNENATSTVNFGLTTGYGLASTSATLTPFHTIVLSGLSASTTYHFQVASADAAGNVGTSGDYTFTTGNTDVIAPAISITAPSDSNTVTGSITFSAAASDNAAIAGVKFYVDNTLVGSEDTTTPYFTGLDTSLYSEGNHTLLAVARDTSQNYATSSSITIVVDNTAPVRSSGSPAGTLSFGTTNTTLSISTSEQAICAYSLSPDNSFSSMTTFSTTNDTFHTQSVNSLSNGGSYIYYVKCQDVVGNLNSTDYIISFTVAASSGSPVVSLMTPVGNTTVSGTTVFLSADASDDQSVSGVQFKLDGNTNIGEEDVSAPYGVFWDSTFVADGSHTIIAIARDNSGNYSTSSITSITVDNTAPVRLNGSPVGSLAIGTTNTTLSLTTDEVASCRYSTNPGTLYGSMTAFGSTNMTNHSTAISGLANGNSYTYYVKCQDGYGTVNASNYPITFSVDIDTVAPVLSNIAVTGISASGATIIWSTNESSNSQVNYGFSSAYAAQSADSSMLTSHSVTLTGLAANTTYHYQVMSRDAQGNIATSSDQVFTTLSGAVASSGGGGGGSSGGGSVTVIYPNQTTSTATSTATSTTTSSTTPARVQVPGCPVGFVCVEQPLVAGVARSQSFPRNLDINNQGNDVKALQKFLNTAGFVVALTGPGSKGKETTLFGPATRAALIKFQKYYKITPAVGYFGPVTRKFIQTKFGAR